MVSSRICAKHYSSLFLFSLIYFLFSVSGITSAADITWLTIDNGNNGDGGVSYEYQISQFEITTAQYTEYLNAIAKTDTYGLYNSSMYNSQYYKGIIREGSVDNYTYTVNDGWADKPVVFTSYYEALRFANWMHNGRPTGLQTAATTEDGAYQISLGLNIVRKDGALVWLPSEAEWYKAAYYDKLNNDYYNYATGSDSKPDNSAPDADSGNSANYFDPVEGYAIGAPYYTSDVDDYGLSTSPYGTYGQAGNVWEWTEKASLGTSNTYIRGGCWNTNDSFMLATYHIAYPVSTETVDIGFRLASVTGFGDDGGGDDGGDDGDDDDNNGGPGDSPVPEPHSIILLVSGIALLIRRIRK